MAPPRPSTLIAELTYQCPLHCPYCSNPLHIGAETYRDGLETEHWVRSFHEGRALGVLQLALTGGEPMLRRDLVELCAGARDAGLYSVADHRRDALTRERAEALKAAGLDHVQISIQSPDPARQRPHRGQPVLREEDRGRGLREGARLAAHHQLRPAPTEPRSGRGAARPGARSSAPSASSWPTRSTTAGRCPTSRRSCRHGSSSSAPRTP